MEKSNAEAKKILEKYRNIVCPVVKKYLSQPKYPPQFSVPRKYEDLSDFHSKLVSEYPLRKSKYTRPTLLLLTCYAMGVDIEKALNTAAAMQISEEWLLIHDDFQDNSEKRRGLQTLHKIYGPELAVNAGDTLQIIMWKALSENYQIIGEGLTSKILDEFYLMIMRTTLGQTAEIKFSQSENLDFTEDDYFFIVDGKTSYYSVAGPMRLGAMIAGANEQELDYLSEFGKYLGRAYQIIDDILDIEGDFNGLKEQKGNDIFEGKRTLILCHLIKNIESRDKEKLTKIFLKKRQKKTQDEVNWVTNKMNEYGSIQYARDTATKHNYMAEEIMRDKLTFLTKEPYLEELKTLIYFFLNRNY